MERNCTSFGNHRGLQLVYSDLGLAPDDVHTMYTEHPKQVALGAFLDFMFLMDSTIIVRTRSSFSGMVTKMKEMPCFRTTEKPGGGMWLCMPKSCGLS